MCRTCTTPTNSIAKILMYNIVLLNRYKSHLGLSLICLHKQSPIENESTFMHTVMMYVYGGCGFEPCSDSYKWHNLPLLASSNSFPKDICVHKSDLRSWLATAVLPLPLLTHLCTVIHYIIGTTSSQNQMLNHK